MASRRVIITSGVIPAHSMPSCSGDYARGSTLQTPDSAAQDSGTCSQPTDERSLVPGRGNSPRVTFLQEWRILDPTDIINFLNDSTELLEELLENEVQDKEMDLLVGALGKACNYSTGSEKIRGILNFLQQKDFLEVNLTPWIARWKCSTHLSDRHKVNFGSTVFLLKGFLKEVPESVVSVKVITVMLKRIFQKYVENDIQISQEVISAVQDLPEIDSNYRQTSRGLILRKGNAGRMYIEDIPDDFRKIPILPTSEELQHDFKPFLRTNIVNGCYDNVHHYLDVHFRLLREDFVQPLREGIAEYTTDLSREGGSSGKRIQSFRVYHNVRAIDIIPSQGGMVYILQFEVDENIKRIRWEFSKRLIFGSLVCLSRDNFQTLIFGTVANSDPEKLREGRVEVAFEISEDVSQELLLFSFKMAESSSYFEAYRHVLKCLQTVDQEYFPFRQYFISTSSTVNLPEYIRKNPDIKFALCSFHQDNDNAELEDQWNLSQSWQLEAMNMKQVKVSEKTNWPSADETGLDDSQMEAFKAALREEVCLIQGPPGTGKTYVGLKIVDTLLRNKHKCRIQGPLLVVCYTNHALDQFLEGILDTTHTGIVRIGGRSSSDKMKDLNINKVARERSLQNASLRREYGIAKSNLEKCANKMQQTKFSIDIVSKKILKYRFLSHEIDLPHQESLCIRKFKFQGNDILAGWLGIVDETGRISDTLSTQSCRLVGSERLSKKRRVEDERATDTNNAANEGKYYRDYNEFERRYLDGEDDFFRFMVLTDNPKLDQLTINLPEYYVNKRGRRVSQIFSPKQIDTIIETKLSEPSFMTQEEVDCINDVWELDVQQRWRLYRFWVHMFIERRKKDLSVEHREFNERTKEFKALILRERLAALRGISVIGATTTGAAKNNDLLKAIAPPIVVIEEAAEILEAHVITSLSANCQHLILIGDHQQLRPNPTVYKLCKDYKLNVSLFERLINNGMPCHRLSVQHRMRPEISHLLKIHKDFYPGLLDHEMVKTYDHVRGTEKDVYFIEHNCLEQHNDEIKSRSNLHEALFMASLCKYLLQQGYTSEQITILTAYQGQVRNFMDFRQRKSLGGVRICPIDNFQGEENDIILISFVRSNYEGSIGFLKVSNRVCVALSRAKKGLYCIGNFSLMAEESELWKVIISDLRERELIGPELKLMCRNHPQKFAKVSCADDFREVPDGGCSESCKARLNCGHTCQKKCHPEDKEHQNVSCMKPCERKCDANSHQCKRLCYQPCKELCTEKVKKVLPCSHEVTTDCNLQANEVRCKSKCDKMLSCGHQCQRLCYEECTVKKCNVEISKTFEPCGHVAAVPCFQTCCPKVCRTLLKCDHLCSGTCGRCRNGRFHEKCERRCKRILVCGHECDSKCNSTCPPCKKPCGNRCQHNKCMSLCGKSCVSCAEPCLWECRHLRCEAKCGEDCDRKVCDESCELQLKCGHLCIGLCGEPCPPFCRVCDNATVTRILFGNEDEPGAKFVFLEECCHIVEVKAMDRLMTMSNSDEQQIKLPECPWCKTPIRFNPRYNNRIKAIRRDVEQVKRQILGRDENCNATLRKVKLRVAALKDCGSISFSFIHFRSFFTDVKKDDKGIELAIRNARSQMCLNIERNIENEALLTFNELSKVEVQLDMFQKLQNLYRNRASGLDDCQPKLTEIDAQLTRFQEDFIFLLNKTTSFSFATEQQIEDFQREYKRCCHTVTFIRVLKAFSQPGVKIENLKKERDMLEVVEKLLSDGKKFDDEKESKVAGILKELKTQNPLLVSIGITEDERDMVVKAMGFTRGHWFKCPNGHVYAIGECGGAMQRSQCPECKASIGGESHRLDEGNVVASEMDGALHPAYSEGANNMMNFEELV
ncbi:NFX1-type zinc finger-containing protein 1 [Holothuria leucospilota]|uniref:NFX1-type zinc finger-containing protein 1 n=1 Tax=Holothuria leucospilota TaxID=206669 RepID=A0A9Q1CCC1_HOLLE|nr:NFX1-type zinc finger-containing protein 1 [Holothuria leucospilota]